MRKKSKYRPRPQLQDPVNWVISGLKPLHTVKDEHLNLLAKNHSAMLEITQGHGTRDHIDTLIAALNMSEALFKVRASLGSDWAEEIRSGQDALFNMIQRGIERGNRFIFTGPEIQAINLVLQIHDEQLNQCSVAELEAAIHYAKEAIRNKRARVIERKESACGSCLV